MAGIVMTTLQIRYNNNTYIMSLVFSIIQYILRRNTKENFQPKHFERTPELKVKIIVITYMSFLQ